MIAKTNLLREIPAFLDQEWVQTLCAGPHARIERIVSRGHTSPANFWYDQNWDEWVLVLQGHALLQFEEPIREVELTAGDALLIPARARHRVAWTDPAVETIWVAVHFAQR